MEASTTCVCTHVYILILKTVRWGRGGLMVVKQ
jgi:hypothetical protein